MIKFKEAVLASSKIKPVTMNKEELKLYKKMDKYVTKCIKKAIKNGFKYVTINTLELEISVSSILGYNYYAELLSIMLVDYKKELIKEGFKIESDTLNFKISWSHGMNKDA